MAKIEAALEAELVEGPDYARCRRGSEFRDAPPVNTDGNFRARVIACARALEARTHATREKGKHGGALGQAAVRLLHCLLFDVPKQEGRLYPTIDTLARLALMCRQTVITALAVLERARFLTRYRRVKRITTPIGAKVVQDSNAYTYDMPNGLGGLGWAADRSESNESTPLKTQKKEGLPVREPTDYGTARALGLACSAS